MPARTSPANVNVPSRRFRREVGSLAVDLAGRVIGDSLDRDRQLSLVDRYIEDLAAGGGSGTNR